MDKNYSCRPLDADKILFSYQTFSPESTGFDADDMWKTINDSISRLNLAKLVQISMEGPHVNWKLYEMIQGNLKQNLELTCTVCLLYTSDAADE